MTALTVQAHDLLAGDVIKTPNWDEHVVRAWPDVHGTAVVVSEFPDLVLHYPLATIVNIERVP